MFCQTSNVISCMYHPADLYIFNAIYSCFIIHTVWFYVNNNTILTKLIQHKITFYPLFQYKFKYDKYNISVFFVNVVFLDYLIIFVYCLLGKLHELRLQDVISQPWLIVKQWITVIR